MRTSITLALLATMCLLTEAAAQPPSSRLELRESMWLNLHHFLYVLGRHARGQDQDRVPVSAAAADTAGMSALSGDESERWRRAIHVYRDSLSGRNIIFDAGHVSLKNALAGAGNAATLGDIALPPYLRRTLEDVAPIYRMVWWTRHQARNAARRNTLDSLRSLHGDSLEHALERIYRRPWPAEPIRVDLSAHTSWSGAFTTTRPPHIMFGSTTPTLDGTQGLEILYHEAMHVLEDSLIASLRAEARRTNRRLPSDLSHALLFFTVGEVTRRLIPGHVPYADVHGISSGQGMGRFFPALREHWRSYLDGEVAYEEAIRRLVAATSVAR